MSTNSKIYTPSKEHYGKAGFITTTKKELIPVESTTRATPVKLFSFVEGPIKDVTFVEGVGVIPFT